MKRILRWVAAFLVVAVIVFGVVEFVLYCIHADDKLNKWVNDCVASGNVIVPGDDINFCVPPANAPH